MTHTRVEFGSLLSYASKYASVMHAPSKYGPARAVVSSIKYDKYMPACGNTASAEVARSVKHCLDLLPFSRFFGKDAVLVPVPTSSSSSKTNMLWPAQRIADELAKRGLGVSNNLLRRHTSIRQSKRCYTINRPLPSEHCDTMDVAGSVPGNSEIVLVDDVITLGSTALGAANRLAMAFPDSKVRLFTTVRALTNRIEFSDVFAPRVGSIREYGVAAQIDRVCVDPKPPPDAVEMWNGLAASCIRKAKPADRGPGRRRRSGG